jgi:drug/metabolite transporter (DMT)-like permease
MQIKNVTMCYFSACVAVGGAVGYQYFVKRVPVSLNPIVSVIAMFVAVRVLGVVLLPLFPTEGGPLHHVRQLSWIQLALAVSVIVVELGFLLMYRHGWNLNTGSLVTGVVINLILVLIGVTLLGERVSTVNAIGVALCLLGVALISYRS